MVYEQRESALLARLQRMAGVGGWEIDLLTQAVTWTAETYRIHEVSPAYYSPSLESAINFYVAEHLPTVRKAVTASVKDGTPFDLELELITGQGRRIWVRALAQVELRAGRPRRVFGLVQDITERRRLHQEILTIARHDQDRAVSGLKDDLGQALTGISLLLRGFANELRAHSPSLIGDVEHLVGLMNKAIGTCRTLAKGLAPVSATHGGLIRALRELAEAYSQSRGVAVRIRCDQKRGVTIDEALASHLYRIAQDALVCAVDHEGARSVTLSLRSRPDLLILTVTGDGAPFDATLTGRTEDFCIMRRRAKLAGAALEIDGRRLGGMRVRCALRSARIPEPPPLIERGPAYI
jgi:signal transduction histidine kinase